jgi:iron complex outermembrane recepter protein
VLAGIRGTLRDWRWDLSSGWGGNSVAYTVDNTNNASLGAQSPTTFYVGSVAARQWTSNLDASRELHLGAMPLTLAAGAEFRVDRYQIRAGEPDSWRDGGVPVLDGPNAGQPTAAGAQGMVGLRPSDEVSADRSNSAVYLEADVRPAERLLLQAAARAERYSDFGSTSNGKLAARADIVRGVALRGSVSTGFRAPALTQTHWSRAFTFLQVVGGVSTLVPSRTLPVSSAEARMMGAKPLRPESSVNQSAGVVVDLPRLPLITADYYQITINDRIELGDVVSDSVLARMFEESGMAGIRGGTYFTNGLDTRTRGLDLVASHALLIRTTGVLRIVAGYNNSKTSVIRLADPPPELARFGPVRFNRATRGFLERSQPRETITLTDELRRGAGWAQPAQPAFRADGRARSGFSRSGPDPPGQMDHRLAAGLPTWAARAGGGKRTQPARRVSTGVRGLQGRAERAGSLDAGDLPSSRSVVAVRDERADGVRAVHVSVDRSLVSRFRAPSRIRKWTPLRGAFDAQPLPYSAVRCLCCRRAGLRER